MKKKNVRKLSKKGVALLAAAAMSAMVFCQAGDLVLAEATEMSVESVEISSLLPDNITIEEPTALSNVELPSSEYGTLSWADGSFVPTKRVQSCKVIFESSGKVDLSHITGWDSESQSFTGKITVVVNSIEDSSEETPEALPTEEPEALPTEMPELEPTEIPEEIPEETPGVSEAPELPLTEAPEVSPTETPEAAPTQVPELSPTEIPEEAPTVTGAPEIPPTETPEVLPTETPEVPPTETPEVLPTETPEVAPEETPEVLPTEAPEVPPTEAPEVLPTEAPEVAPTETPEVLPTDTPELPPAETPGVTETPEVPPTEAPVEPTPTEAPDIFDTPAQPEQEERPDSAADNLTPEEQAARAAENHTSNGITVHGDLPWYVQFRVSGGEEYSFRNAEGADIFKSYEFQLWDLKNDTEYQIPDGQYVSVTVPVKAGYDYSVEHILENGATETIIPSVEGTTMVFSTHSFSPFGIAGSKPIVGGEIGDKGYGNAVPSTPDVTATPTPSVPVATPVPTKAPAAGGQETGPVVPGGNTVTGESSQTGGQAGNAGSPDNQISTDNSNNQTGDDSDNADDKVSSNTYTGSSASNNAGSKTQNPKAVKTGDSTMIYPFVILLAVAVIAVIVVVVMKKKK